MMHNKETNKNDLYCTLAYKGFRRIHTLSNIVKISTKYALTLMLSDNDKIYALEYNKFRKLRKVHGDSYKSLELINHPPDVKEICVGLDYQLLNDVNGNLHSIDISQAYVQNMKLRNDDHVNISHKIIETQVSRISNGLQHFQFSTFLKYDNELHIGDKILSIPEKIISISTSASHSLILTYTGNVYYVKLSENNDIFQFLLANLTNIIQVSAGYQYSLMLDINGNIYGLGNNDNGQISLNLKLDYIGSPIIIPDLKDIIQICAHSNFSIAMNSNHKIYGFGFDEQNHFGLDISSNDIGYSCGEVVGPIIIF